MLDRVSARELFDWQAYWRRSPWNAEAEDWRVGVLASAFNGQDADKNRPKWGAAAAPKFVEISFDQACEALAR